MSLMEPLAIRLGGQTTPAKSLVMPRYPEYKDSGIDWLGEVPEHWDVTVLKRSFNVTLGKMLQPESSSPDDELLPYLRAANIQWGGADTTDIKQMWLSKRDRAQLHLESGDLLVSEGGDVGRSCLWAAELDNCYFQNSVNRVRAHDDHSNRYLYYWMSTIKDKGYIDVLCNKSTIAHFTAEKVAAVPVPLPNPAEQAQIAAFLDCETGKIDALIAEQRRLVELLAEKRQAVISHAVTKGLGTCHSRAGGNPAKQTSPRSGQSDCPAMQESSNHLDSRMRGNDGVAMKDSGIAWLGEVPEHWEVMPLKRDLLFLTSGSRGWADHYADDGALFIRIGNLTRNDIHLDLSDIQRVDVPEGTEGERTKVQAGDVLFSITAYLGSVAVVPEDLEVAYVSQHVALARLSVQSLLPRWVAYTTLSFFGKTYFESSGYGGTKSQLSLDDVKNIPMMVPPIIEQEAIIAFLESETAKFDALTLEANRAIALLQERRSALISAAVTGKIDVRKFRHSRASGNPDD